MPIINFFDNQGLPRDPASVKKEMEALTPALPFDANFYDPKTREFYFPNRFKIKNDAQREEILNSHRYTKAGFNKLMPKRQIDADTQKKYFRQESDGEYYYPLGVSSLGSRNNPITLPGVTVYGKSLPEVVVEAPDLWNSWKHDTEPFVNIPWTPQYDVQKVIEKGRDRFLQHVIAKTLATQNTKAQAEKEINNELNRRNASTTQLVIPK